jgi:hypothetical protein
MLRFAQHDKPTADLADAPLSVQPKTEVAIAGVGTPCYLTIAMGMMPGDLTIGTGNGRSWRSLDLDDPVRVIPTPIILALLG